jgi:hypothetical protein
MLSVNFTTGESGGWEILERIANQGAYPSPNLNDMISSAEIEGKTDLVCCMKHIINRFALAIECPERHPWTDIFQQPLLDQKPEELLQRLSDIGHPALPQSWRTSRQPE